MLCFPYISHDSTALCYTEGATLPNTKSRRAADQWCGTFSLHLEIVLLHPSLTQWQALQTQNRIMQSAALEHLNVMWGYNHYLIMLSLIDN